MKFPSDLSDVAAIDWTCAEAQRLTLRDVQAWDEAAARRLVVQPMTDEAAWEGTEIDVCRTVL